VAHASRGRAARRLLVIAGLFFDNLHMNELKTPLADGFDPHEGGS
jgi:hypothetical protein